MAEEHAAAAAAVVENSTERLDAHTHNTRYY